MTSSDYWDKSWLWWPWDRSLVHHCKFFFLSRKSEKNFSVGMWRGSHWFKIKEHKNSSYYFIYLVCSKEQLQQIQLNWKAKLLRCILAPTYVDELRTAELMKKACRVIAVPESSWTAHLSTFSSRHGHSLLNSTQVQHTAIKLITETGLWRSIILSKSTVIGYC